MNCNLYRALIFAIAAVSMCLTASTAAASTLSTLDGQSGSFSIYYPDTTTVFAGPSSFTVGAGQEAVLNAGNITWSLDISGLSLTFGFNDSGCCTSFVAFAGPVVTFTDVGFVGLDSVLLDSTNIGGFDSSRVSFTDNSIYLNIAGGLDLQNQREVRLTVSPAPVPEPATLSLMLSGLGVLSFASRRRKSAAA